MSQQVRCIVAPRVEVKLMGNFQGVQRLIKLARAAVEAKRVLRSAIEIDFHILERWGILSSQHIRAIAKPELPGNRIPKRFFE